MDIQKIKEVLRYGSKMGHLLDFDFRTFDEALVELEKPVDGDEDYSDIIEYLSDCQSGWSDTWQDDIKNTIWHHIEAYHAKKCMECVGQLPAFLHRKQYHPLGQEPVNQQCLSCGLNCPNDCPLDKEPITKNCLTCKKGNTCDLPMDCQGRQWEAGDL